MQEQLLDWYHREARDLPWRRTRDPYKIWVSEVILQQTQVVTGTAYYERFVERFPTVQALAEATLEDVLQAWEGCGYYARARNLHAAAKQITGQPFPETYEGWLALKGVGPYTAAAVSSIAFGYPKAVVDGNVRRVLSRWFAVKEPSDHWLQTTADEQLFHADPSSWNQAVMELGATICTPKAPKCPVCPVKDFCKAYQSGNPTAYPAPKVRAEVKEVQAVALIVGDQHNLYIEKRPEKGLLGGLSGPPLEQVQAGETVEDALKRLLDRLSVPDAKHLGTTEHTMTHRHFVVRVYQAEADLPLSASTAAMSKLDRKILRLLQEKQGALFG
ncbi:A/G-specific adenine glycosylase [Deinococcus cellulosilyticus]|uniref:Adenine DNA glycosylase n=1 Tax=Deinococcus cellulosilyticus (strain DSM 18568 / NBRC 106333 / KACC 11606 / 5516J-15) TaxID=1223518 RepID=A0A511MZB5_DEIC1|nr:A/G-specific adenine glycosylase [Deinococcus cellulosilyticus]GEM45955.1 A/G-specific adenine glycosylase [Deinococcus cellulosilyticus NBRC 106333 = KACC 11606]